MPRHTPPEELAESNAIRARWLAWCGKQNISVSDAVRRMGANPRSNYKWSHEGNIPERWRFAIRRQLGEIP